MFLAIRIQALALSIFSLIQYSFSVTFTEDMFRESAYVYSISLAAIAHTVAKACSAGVISQCGCEPGEPGCLDSVNYALHVAETFINKRFGRRQGKTLNIELIHHNLAAAKQVSRLQA